MIEIDADKIGKKYYSQGKESDITNLQLTDDGLTISVSSWISPENLIEIEYRFNEYRGFRYLDEVDLFAYWGYIEFGGGYHLYEITNGGWKSGEVKEKGVLDSSLVIEGLKEYFIATTNGCLTILAFKTPEIREIEFNEE
ncbi:hypothetical protein [Aquimarina sp. 2304DJ70-9]|uniref:hypothetical protein n=1 Tax=Aquimarina penaris TaxID=3231044 RepID=UPI00346211CC